MRKFLILACLTLPTASLAGIWEAPKGCDVFMTVQAKACRVSHFYTCGADAPGDQWRVDIDQEGPFFYSRIDSEAQWIESYDPIKQTLDPSPADPASFSELLASGIDTWDFNLSRADGSGSRATGYDRLGDGQWLPIDGSPVEFIFPGEEGFLSTQPKYDCDALTANAPATILPASLKE